MPKDDALVGPKAGTVEVPGVGLSPAWSAIAPDVPPEITMIGERLRSLIHEMHPDVVEVVWPRQRIIGFGLGPKKGSEHYAYISLHDGHANLGFNFGARLRDPHGIVRGTGKLFRHARVRGLEEAEDPRLRALLEQAIEERRAELFEGGDSRTRG